MSYSANARLSPRADFLIGMTGTGVVVALWCFITYTGRIKPLFLPSPTAIWEGLTAFQQQNWLLPAILRSTLRVTEALGLVLLCGLPIGLLMGTFPIVDAALRKIVNGGKSVPTTGIMGLIILWFSIEEKAKIVFLFIGSIFYMIILIKNAVQNVSPDYVRVAVDMGATPWQVLTRVLLPGALPRIWEAIAVCNGIMWTYIVLAEFINSNEEQLGLGYLLQIGTRTNEPGRVFGVLIVIALISSVTDWILQSVRARFFPW